MFPHYSPWTYLGAKGLVNGRPKGLPKLPRAGRGDLRGEAAAPPPPPTTGLLVCSASLSFQDLRGVRPGVNDFLIEAGLSWGEPSKSMRREQDDGRFFFVFFTYIYIAADLCYNECRFDIHKFLSPHMGDIILILR